MRFFFFAPIIGSFLLAGCGSDEQTFSLPDPPPAAQTFASGFVGPEGLAFDGKGRLFVGNSNGIVSRVSPEGEVTVFAETGSVLAGIVLGPGGDLFAADFGGGRILRIDSAGTVDVAVAGISTPNFLAFDLAGTLYVSSSGTGQVLRIAPEGNVEVFAEDFEYPNGLAFGPSGEELFIAETVGQRISRVAVKRDGTAGSRSVYAQPVLVPDGIAFDVAGNLYVAHALGISVVTPEGEVRSFVTMGEFNLPASLAFGRGRGFDEETIWFTNLGAPLGTGTTVGFFPVGIPGLPLAAP